MITQEELQEILHYNPETGIFTWKINANRNRAMKGTEVSSISRNGYGTVVYKRKRYGTHRLAWLYIHGKFDTNLQIDHINHNRLDNRICNLRLVTRREQNMNLGLRKDNTSGVTGVKFREDRGKWEARIRVDNKRYELGHYVNKEDAVKARKEAEAKYGFHKNHGRAKTS